MSKTLDPIIVNPPKKGTVQPFTKEDIVKIAFDVLADLGDEVINKAIKDGKISIPQNINVEDLPYIEDIENLTIEDVNKIRGKCFNWDSIICYPICILDGILYYVAIADDTYLYVISINYTDESNIVTRYVVTYPLGDLKVIRPNVDLPENPSELTSLQIEDTTYKVGGTTLYKHTVTFSASAPLVFISLVSTALTRGDDLISWNKDGKIINGTLSTYGRILSIFADSNNNYKVTVVYTLDNFDGSSQDFYNKVALTDFVGDIVTEL